MARLDTPIPVRAEDIHGVLRVFVRHLRRFRLGRDFYGMSLGELLGRWQGAMTRRIHVLQVITRLVKRGASRHVIDLARSLDPERFEVEILAGRGEPCEGSLWEEAEATGLRLHYVDSLQRAISLWQDWKAYREILGILRRGNYDIVHTHISKSGLLGRLAARRAGVPVVVHTYHGVVGELAGAGVGPWVLRAVERRCARLTDECITISERVAEELEAAGIVEAAHWTAIANGIDLEHYRREKAGPRPVALPEGPRVIGTVGSLTREKGTEDLLGAAAALLAENADLTVCIVGDGPLRGTLEAQARFLRISDHVVFTGVVSDVRPWLAAFDVFVLPSHSEGMPLSLVEAMAMGCPVVTTDVGGVGEVVGDAAVLVNGEPEGLRRALAAVLSDDDTRRELGERGLRRAPGFDLATMATRTGQAYEQLLRRRRTE